MTRTAEPVSTTFHETLRSGLLPRLEAGWDGVPLEAGTIVRPLNFGRLTTAPAADVEGAHRALRTWATGRFTGIVGGAQVHGARVARVDDVRVPEAPAEARPWTLRLPRADGFVTATAGILLTVGVADCVPALVVAPAERAAALVHAGWRGVAGEILPRAVEILTATHGADPATLQAYWGPAIGACCYPVGEEVVEAVRATSAGGDVEAWLTRAGGETRVDLRAALSRQAAAAGLDPARVRASERCTACEEALFHSYRAAAGGGGRMLFYAGFPLG